MRKIKINFLGVDTHENPNVFFPPDNLPIDFVNEKVVKPIIHVLSKREVKAG